MSEHTGTPWMTDNVDVFALDAEGFRVAKVCHLINESRDGAFIVRACNSHDELCAVIEKLLEVWDPEWEPGKSLRLEAIAALSKAKALPPAPKPSAEVIPFNEPADRPCDTEDTTA